MCYLSYLFTLRVVPTDAEITFADHTGRFYARRYGIPPVAGRLLGYLMVCDPPEQSIAQLADALLASRSAIAGAINALEITHVLQRSRAAGERMDRVRIDMSSPQAKGMDISEYEELRDIAYEGLRVVRDASIERQAALLELAAFGEFLVERIPALQREWEKRREELVAEGRLQPHPSDRQRIGHG